MADPAPTPSSGSDKLEPWEERLIRTVGASYDCLDREDLAAELSWRLLILKRQSGPGITNWRAYVSKFLRNKASNWIRKNRPRERQTVSLDAPIVGGTEDSQTLADLLAPAETNVDVRLALEAALNELPKRLRAHFGVLVDEEWNQTQVARRLGKHRNTIRTWVRAIRRTLVEHGVAPEPHARRQTVKLDIRRRTSPKPHVRQRALLAIPWPIIERLALLRASGTEWKLALWVMLRSFRRQQTTVPFSWHSSAEYLNADHAGVSRAGKRLLRGRVLFRRRDRIGFQRNVQRWRKASDL